MRHLIVVAWLAGCTGGPAHPSPPPPRDAAPPDAAESPAAVALDRALARDVDQGLAQLAALPSTGILAADLQAVLVRRWPAVVAALVARGTPTSAYFALARAIPPASVDAPVRKLLAALAERAVDAEIELARTAKGVGGNWLHATLAARIAGGKTPRVAAAALAFATTVDLDFTPGPSSCSWVDGPRRRDGRQVVVTMSALSCSARAGASHISGTVTLRWDDGELSVPIDATAAIGAEAVRALHQTLIASVTKRWADDAYARATAALAGKDLPTAEDQLVLHARYVAPGPPSQELAGVMRRYGVTYPEL